LFYLTPTSDSLDFLRELRLQNLERFDQQRFASFVQRTKSTKLQRALANLLRNMQTQDGEFESL